MQPAGSINPPAVLLRLACQDVAADIASGYPELQAFIKEINEYRTSRANINSTFATLKRRLTLDPWLPLVTTVSSSAVSAAVLAMHCCRCC